MIENAEDRIHVGEPFIIRDASDILKPRFAVVIGEKGYQQDVTIQRVILRAVTSPRSGFEFCTERRIGRGVFINRDGRLTFLQAQKMTIEEISQYFDRIRNIPERTVREELELFKDPLYNPRLL